MKKILLVIIAVIGFSVNAQEKGNIEFGFGGGASPFSQDGNLMFNMAGSADYYFSDRWSVKAKIAFDRKAWKLMYWGSFLEGSTQVNADYITIPVMANWHFGGKRNWYLGLGPYAGLLLNAKERKFGHDYKDSFETTDFGLNTNVGVKIRLSDKIKLFIEYELQIGLTDAFKGNVNEYNNARDAFNVGINFML